MNNINENFKQLWNIQCNQYNIKQQPYIFDKVYRIIVLGDIHGDLSIAKQMLIIAKVIDDNDNWIGKDTIVVQVGDQIDRCRYTGIPCNDEMATEDDEGNDLNILAFFTLLHKKAEEKGGAVYSLIGNHELMNVNGDMRYVSYKGLYEKLSDPTIKLFGLNGLSKNTNKLNNKLLGINIDTIQLDAKINGKENRKNLFQPGNPISNFLACTRHVALIIGSNLFVHAGIVPEIAEKYSVEELNKLMSLYLWDKLKENSNNDIFNSSELSPLWTRHFDENKNCNDVSKTLEIYKVGKIIVGHTPKIENGITSTCNNKLYLTDIGASKAFDKFRTKEKKIQVLEILNDNIISILTN